MITFAVSDPQVTRSGWVRCLGGWVRDFGDGWKGCASRTFGHRFTWTLIGPARESEALKLEGLEPRRRLDPKEQTFETPDDAAEACERAREEMTGD